MSRLARGRATPQGDAEHEQRARRLGTQEGGRTRDARPAVSIIASTVIASSGGVRGAVPYASQ
jgi:hypothetical protein